jgi:hypothetical protein
MIFTVTDTGTVYFEHAAAPCHDTVQDDGRNLRFARSLRLRRAAVQDEMEACQRLADALFAEFTELAETDKALRAALTRLELHLQVSGAYYICDEQISLVLDRIAEVGADIRRFCEYLGVEGIAKIPAHEFDDALAALEAKRRRAA